LKPFAGFIKFINNPYLLGIALFIFLYTFIGSFAYFEIKNLMMENDRITNTEIWAAINLSVNSISIVTAMFVTSRITQYLGMGKTLFLVPFLVSIGLMVVFVNPILATIIITWVLLKAGNYSITRPGREMLYTSVGREDRFKTKQVIDIVVYRGGDVFSGWMFAFLTAILGLGMAVIAVKKANIQPEKTSPPLYTTISITCFVLKRSSLPTLVYSISLPGRVIE
jgi:AAA family ATP:ADP antiporter